MSERVKGMWELETAFNSNYLLKQRERWMSELRSILNISGWWLVWTINREMSIVESERVVIVMYEIFVLRAILWNYLTGEWTGSSQSWALKVWDKVYLNASWSVLELCAVWELTVKLAKRFNENIEIYIRLGWGEKNSEVSFRHEYVISSCLFRNEMEKVVK